jgi:hypothetical protein
MGPTYLGAASMRDTIKMLRETLPPLLTVQQYCRVMNRCQAASYIDFRNKPGLAVKVGGSTRIVRDFMLDEMARLPVWVPQKERPSGAGAKTAARTPQARSKQTATPRCERDPEVRP